MYGIVVDVVVFDSNNPSFRYTEGLISQNYLNSKTRIQIPSEGIERIRTYIVGVASFEVSVNAPISMYAAMDDQFYLEIGPYMENGEINHIDISYLVLSLHP